MKIGIIGTGALGGTIAKKLVAAGHEIKATNASQEHELAKIAAGLGVTATNIRDVVRNVDAVFISIPTYAITALPNNIFEEIPDDVIVIDTCNYYPFRDGVMEEFSNGKLESVWVAEQLGRPVVKAFNNLLAYTLEHEGKAKGEKGRIAMAISGNDQGAKEIVSGLINDAGFDAIDAGSLSESWRHQPGMPAYCTELNAVDLRQALADADDIKAHAAYLRDLTTSKLIEKNTVPSHEEMLDVIRSLFPHNPKRS